MTTNKKWGLICLLLLTTHVYAQPNKIKLKLENFIFFGASPAQRDASGGIMDYYIGDSVMIYGEETVETETKESFDYTIKIDENRELHVTGSFYLVEYIDGPDPTTCLYWENSYYLVTGGSEKMLSKQRSSITCDAKAGTSESSLQEQVVYIPDGDSDESGLMLSYDYEVEIVELKKPQKLLRSSAY